MPVLPNIYMLGVWFSIVLAIFFISIYAWQISEESRQLVNALAATELVLAREQHSPRSTDLPPRPRTHSARRCRPSR